MLLVGSYVTDDVVQQHGYCDHFVTMCICGCVDVYVSTIKQKLLIGMTWNLA